MPMEKIIPELYIQEYFQLCITVLFVHLHESEGEVGSFNSVTNFTVMKKLLHFTIQYELSPC